MWSLTRGVESWKNHNILFMAVHCGASLKVKTISSSAYTTLGVDWMAFLDSTVREADVDAQKMAVEKRVQTPNHRNRSVGLSRNKR